MPKTKKSNSSLRLSNDDQERLIEQQNRRKNAVEVALGKMKKSDLLSLVGELKAREPGLILDILERGQSKTDISSRPELSPPWCSCDHCVAMPTVLEEKFCGCSPNNCFSKSQDLQVLVLDPRVLALANRYRNDMFGLHSKQDQDINKSFRHTVYRQFVLWQYGRLSLGTRRVIPSCVVNAIRKKCPSKDGNYTGFKVQRLS